MIKRRRNDADSNVLAICRYQAEGWKVLIVRGHSSATPTIQQTIQGTHEDVSSQIAKLGVGRMLVVLPSWACLVRTVRLPASSSTPQLMSALRLDAESRLLGSIPTHRSAMAILGADSPHPVGLVCSWPVSVKPHPAPIEPHSQINVDWVPEIAALVTATKGENIFAALFDPENGSLAACIPTPSGPSFRSTREPVSSGTNWPNRINAIIKETLISELVDPIEVARQATAATDEVRRHHLLSKNFLVLPPDADHVLSSGIQGAESLLQGPDADSIRILLGAYQASHGPLAPLCKLRENEVMERPGFLTNMSNRMSTGRFAVSVVIVCIILIVLIPLAASSLRLMLVKSKINDINALKSSVSHTENLIEVYRTLDDEAWSMTKLLGDISNCMPETLETSSIVLTHGEPISIDGISKSDDSGNGSKAVLEFAHRLRQTGLFEVVEPSFSPPDGRGIREFKITAEVNRQSQPISFIADDDYAVRSYSERRWGEVDEDGYLIDSNDATRLPEETSQPADLIANNEDEPTRTASEDPAEVDAPDERGDIASARNGESRRASPRGSSSTGSTRGAPRSRSQGRGEPAKIPDPVTAEEVSAMNRSEALQGLSVVAKAKNTPGIDEETKNRLQQDFDLLMQRVRETAP